MNNKKTTCCFTGHRFIAKNEKETVIKSVNEAILDLYKNKGVKYFMCGGALGFDTMAAKCVLEMKKEYGEVKLVLALPCKCQADNWKQKEKDIYESVIESADEVVYISDEYTKECMHQRNQYMVDNSDYIIAYKRRERSGTAYTVKYAEEKHINLINV